MKQVGNFYIDDTQISESIIGLISMKGNYDSACNCHTRKHEVIYWSLIKTF